MPMTLKLLFQAIVGIFLTIVWWGLYAVTIQEAIEFRIWSWKRRRRELVIRAYRFGLPILLALVSLPFRNWWVTIALLFPLIYYLFGEVAKRTEEKRMLGDWVWVYAYLVLVALVLGYTFSPILKGDTLHAYNNFEGLLFGLGNGAITGVLAVLGGVIGGASWRSRQSLGGIVGGVVAWLILLVLLTIEFDAIAIRIATLNHYASPLRLYVVGFIPACVVLALLAVIVTFLIMKEPSYQTESEWYAYQGDI